MGAGQPQRSIPARAGETPRSRSAEGQGGSIPARAGETAFAPHNCPAREVYPRTGGGNQYAARILNGGRGLSPHGRGKPDCAASVVGNQRSIPARAGETNTPEPPNTALTVYPRTGGGNPLWPPRPRQTGGLSPHGRGKPVCCRPGRGGLWSIPARAGETSRGCSPVPPSTVYPRTGGGN